MRPRRVLTSALVLASTLGLLPGAHADAAERVTPLVPVQTQRQQIVDGINRERAAHSLPALTVRSDVQGLAQAASEHLLDDPEHVEHSSHWSTDLWRTTGCSGGSEVLAGHGGTDRSQASDGTTAVQQWLASPSHHDILIKSTRTDMGVGVAYGSYVEDGMTWFMTFWVVDFVGDCPAKPAPGPVTPTPAPSYSPGPTIGTPDPTLPSTSPTTPPKPIKISRKHRIRAHR